jgi:hypothetical protein
MRNNTKLRNHYSTEQKIGNPLKLKEAEGKRR